jgi:RNA polymerase sigma-70 factor (ECF subfamily)
LIKMVENETDILNSLAQRARQGDKAAFSSIARLMMTRIVALTYKMTGDLDSAKDLAQETFITAWEKLSQFRGESKFSSWLYRIATTKSLNHLKLSARRQELNREAASQQAAPVLFSDDLESKERRERVMKFVTGLPEMQRAVFELRFYKQMTFAEIAEAIGKAEGTAKTHYRLAVAKLREHAQKEGWAR